MRIALAVAFAVVAWRGYARFADNPAAFPVPETASQANREYFAGMAMGSPVTITIDADDPAQAKAAARAALVELERLDRMLSDWKESSDLSAFNRSGMLKAGVPSDFARILGRALEVARLTDGRFDPTVAPLVRLWRTSKASGVLPDAATLAAARARCGSTRVSVVEMGGEGGGEGGGERGVERDAADVELDFGGIGKGFGAIAALETLRANGCARAIVAVAGDIAVGEPPRGEAGWKIDVESDARPERIVVARCAVSTSGATEQFVEIGGIRYAHIVDPRTGLGATDAARATVIGPLDAAVDALGTALALTKDDAELDAILARFPGYGARIERGAGAASRVTYHGAWKQ